MKGKPYCTEGGRDASDLEQRRTAGSTFVQCPGCGRILKPTGTNKLRQHQTRNKSTASLDSTREILWHGAVNQKREHFAIGLTVYVRHGAKPVGWDGDDWSDYWNQDDYDRHWQIRDVSQGDPCEGEGSSFEAGGWFWDPQDLTVTG